MFAPLIKDAIWKAIMLFLILLQNACALIPTDYYEYLIESPTYNRYFFITFYAFLSHVSMQVGPAGLSNSFFENIN